MLLLFFLAAMAFPGAFPAALRAQSRAALPRTVVIDTDAGYDDLMATAFLLSRLDVRVEAITVVNGETRAATGAEHVLRLLELAGRRDIPVYIGEDHPLSGESEFPAQWRESAEKLSGITLPEAKRKPESISAVDFLTKRLADTARPFQILTLGPLTNVAAALTSVRRGARAVRQIVIMGGAIGVAGNLGDGGAFKTTNTTAEWNMFVDHAAAKIVFASAVPIRLVPLDATQRVRVDMALFEEFQSHSTTPLARFVAQILAANRDAIHQGYYFAWDPLAAVAFVNPAVATFRPLSIEISEKPDELGRTTQQKNGRANVQAAMDADELRFRETFMKAFGVR